MAYKDPEKERQYHQDYNRRHRENIRQRKQEYYRLHRERWLDYARRHRRKLRANRYGISVEEMDRLLAGGACNLCGKQTDNLLIDHDHTTGQVRGALCVSCNTGLGKLGDTIEGLQRAVTYLERGRYDSNQAANGLS